MFNELELKNFRQHRDLKINFNQGVVAIRGVNESGKSTLNEAIAYALFGATALREPLADTVTWGEKDSSLRVRLVFTLDGQTFEIRRSKSGAEITNNGTILATGQTEVKRYIEALLGQPADVCTNLMLANQASVRGALAKGPSAAIELIESLANFSLIDNLIGLAQTKLPSGATVSVEARIQMLEDQAAEPVVDDTGEVQAQYDAAMSRERDLQADALVARDKYNEVQEPARAAEAHLNALKVAQQKVATAQHQLITHQTALDALVIPTAPSDVEIAELRRQAADAGRLVKAADAARTLNALPEPENVWGGALESLQAELKTVRETVDKHKRAGADAQTKIATAQAQKITQTACGLCGKDLRNVPEVVTKNAELDQQIEDAFTLKRAAHTAQMEAEELATAYQGIVNAHLRTQTLYAKHAEFIELDISFVPHRWKWVGPADLSGAGSNALALLTQAEARVQARDRALGQKQERRASVETAQRDLMKSGDASKKALKDAKGQQEVLNDAAARIQALNTAENAHRIAQQASQTALQQLNAAKALLGERQRARKLLEAQIKAAQAELAEINDNNALIKAIRVARTEVSDELWSIVNASVSKNFSDIRGFHSTVTREGNGFKVDGQSIGGLSGSALDALGLAIRVALTKTFLPSTSFMILDEASAACDDNRTSTMAGTLAGAGFDQILWVTHDEAITAFAQQVIQL